MDEEHQQGVKRMIEPGFRDSARDSGKMVAVQQQQIAEQSACPSVPVLKRVDGQEFEDKIGNQKQWVFLLCSHRPLIPVTAWFYPASVSFSYEATGWKS